MARQVEIASGYKAVVLPDGNIYKAGDVVTLTNAEWDRVNPDAIGTVILDQGSLADPDVDASFATDAELAGHANDADAHGGGVSTAQVEAIIKSGTAAVQANVLPPGLRIPEALLVSEAYVRLGTAPTGSDFIVAFKRNGVQFTTVTVPAGVASGSVTGLSEQFVAGDVLTWDITQVGSTTAGSDVAAAVFGTL